MISSEFLKIAKKQHYGIAGKNSAVQICRWTKKSLLNEGFCYKEKFYGISSHLCCQMSPSVAWCHNKCLHCWRAIEYTLGSKLEKKEVDSPKIVINECITQQRKMLSGFNGNKKVNKAKFAEASDPTQFAISLAGEPTIYPFISELISQLRKMKKTSFLVTNGMLPQKIKEMKKEDSLPTQLYVSVNAPNKEIFNKICNSSLADGWERLNKTLKEISNIHSRTVFRMNLVRELNMTQHENYAAMIKKSKPSFVEIKGFMSVGFSRQRLPYERMPSHQEIMEFSQKIAKLCNLKVLDEKIESRVVVLGKDKKELKIKKKEY
ncbi:MAG: 4-demethylwyosine synthase TYW1 [archaeon]